ncbi:sigma-70 family RNA polymerase sigma factor [Phenylobacterium sp. LjRoot164]|uniref:RNA polymerase sigma factor n=1 Tax=unclassified Phenylobacterium TaxID=2640670 RepID=UPI003ECC2EC3
MRKWLARRWRGAVDAEDVIQEAYCRIAGLARVDHIDNPAAYFHRTVHTAATDMARRAGANNLVSVTQEDWFGVIDSRPLQDRALEAAEELHRVNALLSGLSDTCRRVIELRRIEGLSRKETSERLGVSENDVKNLLVRGLQKVLKTIAEQEAEGEDQEQARRKVQANG